MGWEWGVETVLDRSDILKIPLSKPYMSMLCDHGLAWSRQMQGLHPDLPSHGRHSSVVLTTTFRVRWSHSALYIPHHRERMVGRHRGIMENERENLHQLTGARDEVFALVLHDLSMDSHQAFSIMGKTFCSTYRQNFMPHIETEKKSGPSKAKNTISR